VVVLAQVDQFEFAELARALPGQYADDAKAFDAAAAQFLDNSGSAATFGTWL